MALSNYHTDSEADDPVGTSLMLAVSYYPTLTVTPVTLSLSLLAKTQLFNESFHDRLLVVLTHRNELSFLSMVCVVFHCCMYCKHYASAVVLVNKVSYI